jgi:GT2 family glycosyltransferase
MEKVAIVVLNCNALRYLDALFKSLEGQDYPNYEIIMVDDNSTDGGVEFVQRSFPKVKIIQNKGINLGACVSLNKGVEQTDAPLIVKLDSDVVVEKDWLSSMIKTLESDSTIGAVGSKILYYDSDEVQDIGSNVDRFGYQINYFTEVGLPKDGATVMDAFYVSGCSTLFRKDLFEKVGRYDEKYFLYKDDLDFCWRVRLLDYRVVTDLNSRIHHVSGVVAGGKTVLDAKGRYHTTPRKRYFGERNTLRTLLKNYSAPTLFWVLPIYFGIIFAEVVIFLFMGGSRVSLAYLQAIVWNIENFPDTLACRKYIQKLRKVPDGEIMKNMVKGSAKYLSFKKISVPVFG